MKYTKNFIINEVEKFYNTKVDKIEKINNSKFIIYLYKMKLVIKICHDDFNSNLFLNEKKAYKHLKKNRFFLHIAKFNYFKKLNTLKILAINFIKGKKVNYLNLSLVIKKNKNLLKHNQKISISVIKHIFKKNFKNIFIYQLPSEFDKDFDNIIKKFPKEDIKISLSHGDFTHHNLIKSMNGSICFIDFEYFSKQRIYIYDILHWLIAPIVNKMVLNYRIKLNLNYLLKKWVQLFFFFINFKVKERDLEKYLLLYYLEQKYFFKITPKLKEKYNIFSYKTISSSSKLSNYYSKLLD